MKRDSYAFVCGLKRSARSSFFAWNEKKKKLLYLKIVQLFYI